MARLRLGLSVFAVLALWSLIGLGPSNADLDSSVLNISSVLHAPVAYAGDPDEYANSTADGDPDEYVGGTTPDDPADSPPEDEEASAGDRYETVALFISGLSTLLGGLPY